MGKNVYLRVNGRLGNQLFQYSFCKWVQMQIGGEIFISFEDLKKHNDLSFSDQLRLFNTKYSTIEENHPVFFYGNLKQKLYYIILYILKKFKLINNSLKVDFDGLNSFEKKFAKKLWENGLFIYPTGEYHPQMPKNCNVFVRGEFEFPYYLNVIRDQLLKDLVMTRSIKKNNEELFNHIVNTNSVCITIRRGDFLSEKFKERHLVTDEKYFNSAVKIIFEKVNCPTFFIFSDEIEWAKNWANENIPGNFRVYAETGNDSVDEKLFLMQHCKHFIISNSTFSWWAQWLSQNNAKIVIGPSKWKNTDYLYPLIQDNWLTIDIDKLL